MASTDDVQKLAALARLEVSESETASFVKEFDSILGYVGQIETLQVSTDPNALPPIRNVFREDGEPHESGKYTEDIAAQFPKRDGDSLSVKQIITHD